jgi:DNA-binding MarR family transcriptional regulator
MGELSEALSVPVSTATRMVDWQVANGYVERLSDPDDRRIVRLGLTPVGRRLLRTLDAFLKERIEGVLRRFPAGERDQIIALIRRLVDVLIETE